MFKMFENDTGYTLLYRGDSSAIEQFDVEKTSDWFALFGYGIYLTSDPTVARDYTVKDDGNLVFPITRDDPKSNSSLELIRAYITKLAYDLGAKEAFEKIREKYNPWSNNDENHNLESHGTPEWKSRQDELQKKYANECREMKRHFVILAKKKFQKIKPTLKMIKMTTGEYRFVKANRPATISTFKIPNSYLEKVVHADRPLTDDLIELVRKAYLRTHPEFAKNPNARIDLRSNRPGKKNWEDEFETFDDYISNYKRYGTRYAWSDDNKKYGGKGENPSLDVFSNGTHSGYHAFRKDRETQKAFIEDMLAAGYVGIEYDGGTRITGSGTRGGGNNLHRAFVFWDSKALNSFRIDNHPHQDDDLDNKEKNLRWDTVNI